MNSKPRVVYWDNIPAPYAVERYSTLASRANVDFSVWFARRTDPDRSWDVNESSWQFDGRYVEDPSRGLESMQAFVRRCDEVRPDLVVSLYGEPAFVAGHPLLKARGIRTAFVIQPTYDTWVRRTWLKERAKAILFRSIDGAKVPGPDGLAYAARYGVPPDRVSFVRQSIDVDLYARTWTEPERGARRRELGVDGCVFLYLGRLWKPKGILVLLEAFGLARQQNPRITLLVVGDGPDEQELRLAARDQGGVVFAGFVASADLPSCYAAADVFVFPTLGDPNGLVVEEAHASGLPVISSDAAGDIRQRVIDDVNGFVVPAGQAGPLAARMVQLAADAELRARMGKSGLERVQSFHHATWAEDFEAFVARVLEAPNRHTAAARCMALTGSILARSADLVARSRLLWGKMRRTGALAALGATIRARLARARMWLVAFPWRLRRPRLALRKVGTRHGGWILPMDVLASGGACYCIGVGDDTSLEDELLRRTPCRIWSFDPTPSSNDYVRAQALDPSRFTFLPIGVSATAGTLKFFAHADRAFDTYSQVNLWHTDTYIEAPCRTVATLMREHGLDRLALLKISTGGDEWEILDDVLAKGISVSVLCVVFCQPAGVWRIARMVRRLRQAGYVFVAREEWKFTFVSRPRGSVPRGPGTA